MRITIEMHRNFCCFLEQKVCVKYGKYFSRFFQYNTFHIFTTLLAILKHYTKIDSEIGLKQENIAIFADIS